MADEGRVALKKGFPIVTTIKDVCKLSFYL